jgi:hypothetical protein
MSISSAVTLGDIAGRLTMLEVGSFSAENAAAVELDDCGRSAGGFVQEPCSGLRDDIVA